MVTFSVLATIAFVLIVVAVMNRLFFRRDAAAQAGGKKLTRVGGMWFEGLCVVAAMVLLIIGVWVFF